MRSIYFILLSFFLFYVAKNLIVKNERQLAFVGLLTVLSIVSFIISFIFMLQGI